MSRHDDARRLLERVVTLTRLTHSVEQHLLIEQNEQVDAAFGERIPEGDRKPRVNPPDPDEASAVSYTDPTSNVALSRVFARYHRADDLLTGALKDINRALDKAERTFQRIIAGTTDEALEVDTEERCPGWTEELRQRLGGCGKVLERYALANGETVVRPERLCAGCRTAKRRAERDAA